MSVADIGHLGGLKTPDPIDISNYKDVPDGPSLPPAGRYTVEAPASFPQTSFGATQAGFLSATVNPTICSGQEGAGLTVRQKISAKTFQRGGTTVSQFGDYLRAFDATATIPTENEALADAVALTAGRIYQIDADWSVYSKRPDGSVFKLDGMRKFPKNADGTYRPWVEDTEDKDAEGNAKRLRANLTVRRFVTAGK